MDANDKQAAKLLLMMAGNQNGDNTMNEGHNPGNFNPNIMDANAGNVPINVAPPLIPPPQNDMQQLIQAMTQLMQQNAVLVNTVTQARTNQQTQLYSVLPDLSHSIAYFDGISGAESARAWIKQLETTANLHHWTQEIAFETARSHLSKGARNWYLANMDKIIDWKSFRAAFSNTFMLDKSLTEKWREMQARNQHRGENTQEYFFDKVRLCKTLKLGNEETKTQIAVGLWSKEISTAILSRDHFDLDDLLRNIITLETLENTRRQRISSNRESSKFNTGRQEYSSEESRNNSSREQGHFKERRREDAESRETRECYRCHASGHIAKNCQVKREIKCFNCQQVGHISKNCTKPKSMAQAKVNIVNSNNNSNVENNVSAKYEKKIFLGGSELVGLIDPGSSDCLIKASIVLDLGFKFVKAPNVLMGFGGGEARSSGIVYETLKVDDCEVERIRFRVVPDTAQLYDVIIGRNFTELPEIAYFKVQDRLEFMYKENFPFRSNPEIDITKKFSEPESLENVKLPTASINFVRVKVGNEVFQMPITNKGRETISIKKGDKLKNMISTIERSVPKLEPRREPITDDDINVSPNVSSDGKTELLTLLNKYRICSAMNISELGCTSLIKMDIVEKPGSVPCFAKPYKSSIKEREIMKNKVGEWKSAGIVTETTAEYASPCIVVNNSSGNPRVVVDYRRLNKNTVRMNFPLPNIDDGMEELYGASMFIILDLASGYLQIPLTESAKEKTAFITQDETGQFERAMFGLMNAPFYFAKLMKIIFASHGPKLALVYFDDILIHARSWKELLEKLETVLQLLKDAGLTLNLKKCRFGMESVNYLGFEIGKGGLSPGKKTVSAILDFPTPINAHKVRQFHGLASYFRRFVPNFSQIMSPIVELCKENVEFKWGESQEKSFNEIKCLIGSKPCLAYFNPKATRTELHTDASALGLGALLLQADNKNVLHPVYAISRRTSEVEKNYHSSKLELLAIIWAIERLRHFLILVKFDIITDCQALVYVNSLKSRNPQVVRWLNQLTEFNYEIQHRKGEKMKHVDALSRAPVEEVDENLDVGTIFNISIKEEEILMYQRHDENLARKIDILEKAERNRTKREKGEIVDFVLKDGILYKIINQKELYVVPRAMRKALVIKNHDLTSHFGLERTMSRIKRYYYFPNMKNYVKRHIAACVECIFAKTKPGKQAGELHPIPPGNRPFEIINIDHLGPFVTSTKGNKYILATICNLTKYVHLYAVKDTKATTTVRKLEELVEQFGAPKRFITDRGTAFTANTFDNFCNINGIKHTLNSSRHPQANGQVERLNSTILPALITSLTDSDGYNWDLGIKKLARDLNSSICKTTGRTPFEMLYGYIPRFRDGLSRELTENAELYTIPAEIRAEAIKKIEIEQCKAKERYDRARIKNVRFDEGNIVVMRGKSIATGESTKLQARAKGPYVITQCLPAETYRIESLSPRNKIKSRTTAHVSQLRIWTGHDDESSSDTDCGDDSNESDDKIDCDKINPIVKEAANQNSNLRTKVQIEKSNVNENNLNSEDVSTNVKTLRRSSRIHIKPSRYGSENV